MMLLPHGFVETFPIATPPFPNLRWFLRAVGQMPFGRILLVLFSFEAQVAMRDLFSQVLSKPTRI
jgi:hypothetical protein